MAIFNGSAHSEKLVGSDEGDILNGNGGTDEFHGMAGDDTCRGGASSDHFFSSAGNDSAYGGPGDDHFHYRSEGGAMPDRETFVGGTGLNIVHIELRDLAVGYFTLDARPDGFGRGATSTGLVFSDVSIFEVATGASDDLIFTLAGDDSVATGAGNDRVRAGGGNDRVDGGDGNDRLDGGGSSDVLVGGGGRDTLTGGAGGDTFVFGAAGDSGATDATRDVIRDFRAGSDRIDLAGLDLGAGPGGGGPVFLGAAVFSGTAGELRAEQIGRITLVGADLDGDGTADFEIALLGRHDLGSGDFLL